jgi:endonuclease YncB( thermonuclease family)
MFFNPFTYLAASAALAVVQGSATVTDGDTIRMGETRIRLEGIDAPEISQTCTRSNGTRWRCGKASKAALIEKIGQQTVRCEISGTDRYKRSIGTCFVGKLNLNQWMVQNGWSVAYARYSKMYVADEQQARRRRLNIWSGDFEVPNEFRSRKKRRQ